MFSMISDALLPVDKLARGFTVYPKRTLDYSTGWPRRLWGVPGIQMAHAPSVARG